MNATITTFNSVTASTASASAITSVRAKTSAMVTTLKAAGCALMIAATSVVGLVAANVSVPGVPADTGQVQLNTESSWTLNHVVSQAAHE
jgi:hypothetical protein